MKHDKAYGVYEITHFCKPYISTNKPLIHKSIVPLYKTYRDYKDYQRFTVEETAYEHASSNHI